MNLTIKIALALSFVLGACGHPSFAKPSEFARLDESGSYDERATSAHGVVIAVREVEAPKHTSLAFWSEAIRQRMHAGQGYALIAERDIRAQSGEAGRLLSFGHDQNGHTFDYWVAVFPCNKSVVLLEAGGRRDRFDAARPELERALASVTLH
jgi:hypothetical protein